MPVGGEGVMIVNEDIEAYLLHLARGRDPVLMELEQKAQQHKQHIVGPLVGRLCQQIAQSINARDVFEMGSGIGYSTWWFAQAVGPMGRVVHTEADAKRSADARAFLDKAGLAARVHYEVGDGREVIKKYPGPFDVVFIDVDKHGYPEALELARSRVRVGGYIICDDALWSGKMLEPPSRHDADTRAVARYNKDAFAAGDLLTTILPIRNGVALSLKLAAEGKRRR
jgi:predicted O-methyltransferase YrrM